MTATDHEGSRCVLRLNRAEPAVSRRLFRKFGADRILFLSVDRRIDVENRLRRFFHFFEQGHLLLVLILADKAFKVAGQADVIFTDRQPETL